MAVGDKNVGVTVAVQVFQRCAPFDRANARGGDAACVTYVLKQIASQVQVKRVVLEKEVRDEEVRQAISVDVGGIDAHAGLFLSLSVVGGARGQRAVLETAAARID